MKPAPAQQPVAVPRWLPWLFVAALVLPCWPFWLDFEQVRRGLLLLLAGATLLALPALPRVRGEGLLLGFVAWYLIAAVISVRSLQPWEAVYRLAHWLALLAVLRLGAAAPARFASPVAVVLLATSLFGLLQRAGYGELWGYGVEREPVSVFGNLNVASEWTAVGATLVAVLGTAPPWLGRTALVLAAAYLAANGSRSGLVALPAGLLLLALLRRSAGGPLLLLFALLGGGAGQALAMALPKPAPADAAAAAAEHRRGTRTLDVRYEIAVGATKLFAERPVFGWGPGQFAVQYPRVRSDAEIELSSDARKFATEVRTAHDDWLELLVEGGLPGLLLFAGALFALQRGNPDKARLLPLFVLLLLMFVRSPLANAPAVAAALLLVGTPAPGDPERHWLRHVWRGLGVVLCGLGLLPVAAHCAFAPYQAAIHAAEQPPFTAVADAAWWMPWEPRWHQMLAQEHLAQGNLHAASAAAARASALRPHEPSYLLALGEVLARGQRFAEALGVADFGLQVDPRHPELRVLRSTALLQLRRYDEAIAAVVVDPHEVLRAQLASHFRSLARLAEQRGDAQGAARCTVERLFVQAIDELGPDAQKHAAAAELVRQLLPAMQAAGSIRGDLRWFAVSALHAHDLGDLETARTFGKLAKEANVAMPAWQKALLGDHLARLREHEVWFDVLRR